MSETFEAFIQQIRDTATEDLLLILQDQQELYSEEELSVIRRELEDRSSIDVAIGLKRLNRVSEEGAALVEFETEDEDELDDTDAEDEKDEDIEEEPD